MRSMSSMIMCQLSEKWEKGSIIGSPKMDRNLQDSNPCCQNQGSLERVLASGCHFGLGCSWDK